MVNILANTITNVDIIEAVIGLLAGLGALLIGFKLFLKGS